MHEGAPAVVGRGVLLQRGGPVFEENISTGKMLIIAFQHLLTMTPGTIAVPLLLASGLGLDASTTSMLVAANFFTSGITTLIQVIGLGNLVGSRYPIILGSSFAPLARARWDICKPGPVLTGKPPSATIDIEAEGGFYPWILSRRRRSPSVRRMRSCSSSGAWT